MIVAHQLKKAYDAVPVLDGAGFMAFPGEISLLTGVNGAGKTTTLKILAGLMMPDAGSAKLDGIDVCQDRRAAQARLSYLPQGTAFQPAMTPWQLMQFYAGLRGISRRRIEPLLAQADLWSVRDRAAGKLSGGMLQRLGLALLLLPDAPVLILDEPGISLDPAWRDQLREILQAEAARGKTVLITTHLLAEWNAYADACFVCAEGRISPARNARAEALSGRGTAPRPGHAETWTPAPFALAEEPSPFSPGVHR